MPFPLILFDVENGADAALASGAGPSTAVTGTALHGRDAGAEAVYGIYDGSPPDISAVPTDGSACLYAATSSGRKFFKITGAKIAQQSTTGSINNGSDQLTVGSAAGMSVGDLIFVLGAGSADSDLFTKIAGIAGNVITTSDTAGTTVFGNQVICPKHFVSNQSVILSSSVAWALGGKRKEPKGTGSSALAADAEAGWGVRFLPSSAGLSYDFTTTWSCTAGGDTANGKITVDSDPAGARALLKATIAIQCFDVKAAFWHFEHLEFSKCETAILASAAAATDLEVVDCRVYEVAAGQGFSYGVRLTSSVTGERFLVKACEFNMAGGAGVQVDGAPKGLNVEGCFFHAAGANVGIGGSGAAFMAIRKCVFQRLASGISIGGSTACGTVIDGNTFDYCSNGVNCSALARLRGIIIRNCSFSNADGFALNLGAGTDLVKGEIDYNNFWSNNSNRQNVSAGANDTAVDPQFVLAPTDPNIDTKVPASFDYRVGIGLRGKGWPRSIPGSVTTCSEDIGAASREEPMGGDLLARIPYAELIGADLREFGYRIVGGNQDGKGGTLLITDPIPPPGDFLLDALRQNILAAMRDQDSQELALVGKEVRV